MIRGGVNLRGEVRWTPIAHQWHVDAARSVPLPAAAPTLFCPLFSLSFRFAQTELSAWYKLWMINGWGVWALRYIDLGPRDPCRGCYGRPRWNQLRSAWFAASVAIAPKKKVLDRRWRLGQGRCSGRSTASDNAWAQKHTRPRCVHSLDEVIDKITLMQDLAERINK